MECSGRHVRHCTMHNVHVPGGLGRQAGASNGCLPTEPEQTSLACIADPHHEQIMRSR